MMNSTRQICTQLRKVASKRYLPFLIMCVSICNVVSGSLNAMQSLSEENNLRHIQTLVVRESVLMNLYQAGQQFLNKGEYQKAMEHFNIVYMKGKGSPFVHASAASQIALLYRRGVGVRKDFRRAVSYFGEAYTIAKLLGDEYHQAAAASNIGSIYFDNGQKELARIFLLEAYKIAKGNRDQTLFNDCKAFAANYLGNIALYDDLKYTDARLYFEEGHLSSNQEDFSVASSHLGLMYLLGLGVDKNFQRARAYFYQALPDGNPVTVSCVRLDLLHMILMLMGEFDDLIERIRRRTPFVKIKHVLQQLKLARSTVEEASNIKGIESIYDDFVKSLIQEKHNELVKLENQIKSSQSKSEANDSIARDERAALEQKIDSSLKEAEEALINNDFAHTEKVIQTIKNASMDDSRILSLKSITKRCESLKYAKLLREFDSTIDVSAKKNSASRIMRLQNIIAEISVLVREHKQILELRERRTKLSMLIESSVEQTREEAVIMDGGEKRAQMAPFKLLDPFAQIADVPATILNVISTHLEMLCLDPLNNRNAEKIKFLEDTWRIRVGDYRILYTLLPQRHAVGILSIDSRKDVYDFQEVDKRKEEWLKELNALSPEQIASKILGEANPHKLEALRLCLESFI